MRTRFFDVA